MDPKKIIGELQRRVEAAVNQFNLQAFCFDKQLAFLNDPGKFKTAVCSRRAGKTVACAADLWSTTTNFAGINVLYITLSRTSAKRIVWAELLKLRKQYEPDCKVDNTELTITRKNGSIIYVSGAKDESELEKLRGLALKKVYIDEAQSFRPYIERLVDDILVPALYDYDGTLILIGTPGPICAGYFFEACHNKNWANYKWTILDNPWIKIKSGKEPADILAAERARRGIDETNPTYRRESMGEWVTDTDALVYQFDTVRNTFLSLPKGRMEYIFGVDIGYDDADAIAVLGYSYEDKNVYLVAEKVTRKQNITALVGQIEKLREKYNPVKMVMDAGALGKKIQAEIQTRHTIPLEAADKNRKLEFIELLNDDLRTGKFKAFVGSQFEEDSQLVQWDKSGSKPAISASYHTDIGDAVLYAWRECKHYFYTQPPEAIVYGSAAWVKMLEEKLCAELEAAKRKKVLEGPSDDDMAFVFSGPDDQDF